MSAIFGPDCEADLKQAFLAHACSGYCVEVGANHPRHLSQTWHLERRGWDGVLIEPQPELAAARRRRRLAKVYAVACASRQQAGRMMSLHLAGSLAANLNISSIRPQGTIEVAALDEILLDTGGVSPRKHYLGLPFRHLREASRRLRHGTWLPRGKAGPVP
jgi:hypothetical protein